MCAEHLLPLWEKVAEGEARSPMRGEPGCSKSCADTPHPHLRVGKDSALRSLSHKGRGGKRSVRQNHLRPLWEKVAEHVSAKPDEG